MRLLSRALAMNEANAIGIRTEAMTILILDMDDLSLQHVAEGLSNDNTLPCFLEVRVSAALFSNAGRTAQPRSGQRENPSTVYLGYTEPLLYRTYGYTERLYVVTEVRTSLNVTPLYRTSGYIERFFRARMGSV